MTDQTLNQPNLLTIEEKSFNLWHYLTQPVDELQGDDRRKAFSLAAMTLVFLPLGFLATLAVPVIDFLNGDGFTALNLGGLVGIGIIIASYAMSRTKHYQIGAYLLIAAPIVAVIMSAVSSEDVISEIALIYMALDVILCSLLLTSKDTLIVGAVTCVVTALLYFATRDRSADAVFPAAIIIYVVIATAILALVSRIRERNLRELEATQAALAQRMIELEEARDQAEHSNQVKSIFLASMSHELRTPLNAIINFTRFVVKGTLGPVNETQVETLDNVIVSGKHLLNLINDVLDMSKIESGSLNLFVSDDVDITEIVDEVFTTGRALLDEKDVELKKEVEPGLPLILADQQRIRQILLNVISNACKFTEEGQITLSVKQQRDDVLITIADTGPGIAPEDQPAVFEPFKQTETGLRQSGGTGLGMPITKSLVEAHGGDIHLESAVGKGTKFMIHLPIKSTILTPTLISES